MEKRVEPTITIPKRFKEAKHIEEILCLGTLIAEDAIPHESTLADATMWYNKLGECSKCSFFDHCLATIINE